MTVKINNATSSTTESTSTIWYLLMPAMFTTCASHFGAYFIPVWGTMSSRWDGEMCKFHRVGQLPWNNPSALQSLWKLEPLDIHQFPQNCTFIRSGRFVSMLRVCAVPSPTKSLVAWSGWFHPGVCASTSSVVRQFHVLSLTNIISWFKAKHINMWSLRAEWWCNGRIEGFLPGMNEPPKVYPLHWTKYPNIPELCFRRMNLLVAMVCLGTASASEVTAEVWPLAAKHVMSWIGQTCCDCLQARPCSISIRPCRSKDLFPEYPSIFQQVLAAREWRTWGGPGGNYLELCVWIDFCDYVERGLGVLARWWYGQCWPCFCQFSRQTRRHHFLEAGNGKLVALVWILFWIQSFSYGRNEPHCVTAFFSSRILVISFPSWCGQRVEVM